MTPFGPDAKEYRRRREAVCASLEGAVLLVPAAPEAVYANDVHYAYRPATDTRYLCGIEEPATLMLSGCEGDTRGFSLFVLPRDEQSETWTGRRVGLEGAVDTYGADRAYRFDEVKKVLVLALKHAQTLYACESRDEGLARAVREAVAETNAARPRSGGAPLAVVDCSALLAPMRCRKAESELALMRKAGEISAAAHNRLLETVKPGDYEYQVQARVEYAFREAGCSGPAYGTIAAGGPRATVLHYTRNDRRLADGELLLVDAGGEFGGYCADITRTFPVGAAYTAAQAELYDTVLAAQEAAIAVIEPGIRFDAVHQAALRVLCEGLLDAGILSGDVESCIEAETYKPYYMHRTSHWLGMDVHDAGSYADASGKAVALEAGMVLTVEPGLYFREDAPVPERFRGIGIRIEDDVAVTREGPDVLSRDAIKKRTEVEKARKRALG